MIAMVKCKWLWGSNTDDCDAQIQMIVVVKYEWLWCANADDYDAQKQMIVIVMYMIVGAIVMVKCSDCDGQM